jgi:hypothetical protein
MLGGGCEMRALAKEMGVPESDLYNDWDDRDVWLPAMVGLDDVRLMVAREIVEWRGLVDRCLGMADRFEKDGNRTAANGAVKNARDAKEFLSGLVQSMGFLPKVATEYKVESKAERVEVKASDSERDVLNKAASILNKKGVGATESSELH